MDIQYSEYLHGNVAGTYRELPPGNPLAEKIRKKIVPGLMNCGKTTSSRYPENRMYFTTTVDKKLTAVLVCYRKHSLAEAASYFTHAVSFDAQPEMFESDMLDYMRYEFIEESDFYSRASLQHKPSPGLSYKKHDTAVINIDRTAMLAIICGCLNRWRMATQPVRVLVPAGADYEEYVDSAVRQIYNCFPYAMRAAVGFASFPDLNAQTPPEIGLVFAPDEPGNENEYALRLDGSGAGVAGFLRGNQDAYRDFCEWLLTPDIAYAQPSPKTAMLLFNVVEGARDTEIFSLVRAVDYVDINYIQPQISDAEYIRRLAKYITKINPLPGKIPLISRLEQVLPNYLDKLSSHTDAVDDFFDGIAPVCVIGYKAIGVHSASRDALVRFAAKYSGVNGAYKTYRMLSGYADDIVELFPAADGQGTNGKGFYNSVLAEYEQGYQAAMAEELRQIKQFAASRINGDNSAEQMLEVLSTMLRGSYYPENKRELFSFAATLSHRILAAESEKAPDKYERAQQLSQLILPVLGQKYSEKINQFLDSLRAEKDRINQVTDLKSYVEFVVTSAKTQEADTSIERVRHILDRPDSTLRGYMIALRNYFKLGNLLSLTSFTFPPEAEPYIFRDIRQLSAKETDIPAATYIRERGRAGLDAMLDACQACSIIARERGGNRKLLVRIDSQSRALIDSESLTELITFAIQPQAGFVGGQPGYMIDDEIILSMAKAKCFTIRHLPQLLAHFSGICDQLISALLVATYNPNQGAAERQQVFEDILKLPGGRAVLEKLFDTKKLNSNFKNELRKVLSERRAIKHITLPKLSRRMILYGGIAAIMILFVLIVYMVISLLTN